MTDLLNADILPLPTAIETIGINRICKYSDPFGQEVDEGCEFSVSEWKTCLDVAMLDSCIWHAICVILSGAARGIASQSLDSDMFALCVLRIITPSNHSGFRHEMTGHFYCSMRFTTRLFVKSSRGPDNGGQIRVSRIVSDYCMALASYIGGIS